MEGRRGRLKTGLDRATLLLTYGMSVLVLVWALVGPPLWHLTEGWLLVIRFGCAALGVAALRGRLLWLVFLVATIVTLHGLLRRFATGAIAPYHWYELALSLATSAVWIAWIPRRPRTPPVTRVVPDRLERKPPAPTPVAAGAPGRDPIGRLRPSPEIDERPRAYELDIERLRPFGRKLAEGVASMLEAGNTVTYGHRDHCGMGLGVIDDAFVYDEIQDGQFCCQDPGKGLEDAFAVFFDRASFVTWLVFQNDESLSGRESGDPWYTDNQRITRARLDAAVSAWQARSAST